jgi:hypothetical protein
MQFNQTGGTAGQKKLTIVTRVIGKPPTTEWASINYNANISSFLAALNTFTAYKNYGLTGTRVMYDSNETLTND